MRVRRKLSLSCIFSGLKKVPINANNQVGLVAFSTYNLRFRDYEELNNSLFAHNLRIGIYENPIMRCLPTLDYQSLPLPVVVSNGKAAPTQSWTHISFSKHGQEITGHQLMTQQITCWWSLKEICFSPSKKYFCFPYRPV